MSDTKDLKENIKTEKNNNEIDNKFNLKKDRRYNESEKLLFDILEELKEINKELKIKNNTPKRKKQGLKGGVQVDIS